MLLYAHTHQAALWHTADGSDRPRDRRPRPGTRATLDPDGQALLHPGAVTGDRRWLELHLIDTRPTAATWHQAASASDVA